MANVKVLTSVAGADFSYTFGEIVDRDQFAAKVGAGFEQLIEVIEDDQPTKPAPKPKKTKDAE